MEDASLQLLVCCQTVEVTLGVPKYLGYSPVSVMDESQNLGVSPTSRMLIVQNIEHAFVKILACSSKLHAACSLSNFC